MNSPDIFIGVDPGMTGGIVVLDKNKNVLKLAVMPVSEREGKIRVETKELFKFFEPYISLPDKPLIVVEKVWAYQGQGVSSTFTFGKAAGMIIGAIEALFKTNVCEISPQLWQKRLWGRVDDPKQAGIAYVTTNYPDTNLKYSKSTGEVSNRVKIPHQGLVDALAIADFARLHFEEVLQNEG